MNHPHHSPHYSQQGQKQINQMKLVQDQNYSHNILLMAMSTAESLAQRVNKNERFSNKVFRNYDHVNYTSKGNTQLKNQLGLQLMILFQSLKTFSIENHGVQWLWPSNFSFENFQQKLLQYKTIFDQNKEQECSKLIDEFYSIVTDTKRTKNHFMEKMEKTQMNQQQNSSQPKKGQQFIQQVSVINQKMDIENQTAQTAGSRENLQARLDKNDFPESKIPGAIKTNKSKQEHSTMPRQQ